MNKWRINRFGFLNFWYYDDEEFHFSNGKMLLRGANGSGKSVTMQSMFPFMLDGNKSPERLDPFNSRDRSMHEYLCGEKEINDVEERIGYLYIEYVKVGTTNEFLTTGVGLQAKTGTKDLDFWGFVVRNNQRINTEGGILLYEGMQDRKIPLQKRDLIKRFKEHRLGDVVTTQKDYMEMVNKYLFGFESLESFQHLIKLMVLLRSPKLSKDFKVSHMNEILSESLPELTSEELLPFTDSIENLDEIDELIKEFEKSQAAVEKLEQVYQKYNRFLLSEKARRYLQAEHSWASSQKRYHQLLQQFQDTEQNLIQTSKQLQQLVAEEHSLKERQRMLYNSEVFSMESELQKIKTQLEQLTKQIEQAERSLASKKQILKSQQEALATCEQDVRECLKQIRELEGELDQCARESSYFGHEMEITKFRQSDATSYLGFENWKFSALNYRTRLRELAAKVTAEQSLKEKYQKSDEDLLRLKQAIDEKRQQQQEAWAHFDEERGAFIALLYSWDQENKQLHLNEDELRAVEYFVDTLYQQSDFAAVTSIVNQVYDKRYHVLQQRILDITQEQKIIENRMAPLEQELHIWKSKKDPEPNRHPETEMARTQLKEDGVEFTPFFSAVEFREEVTQETRNRIEHALMETGLLDALLVSSENRQRVRISNKVLVSGAKAIGVTLASYVKPTEESKIPQSEIQAILESISVSRGESEFSLFEDGSFKMGVLEGVAPNFGESQFIGKEARERYRQQKIIELEDTIADLKSRIDDCAHLAEAFTQQLKDALAERNKFPSDKPMHQQYIGWSNFAMVLEHLETQFTRQNELVQMQKEKWQQLRFDLLQNYEDIDLEKSLEVVESALQFFDEYIDFLGQLERRSQQETLLRKSLQQMQSMVEETKRDLHGYSEALGMFQIDYEKNKFSSEALEKLLQEKGAQSLRQEVANLDKRLKEVEVDSKQKLIQKTQFESKLTQLESQFETASKQEQFYERLVSAWREVFSKEFKYRFIDELVVEEFKEEMLKPLAGKIADEFELSDASFDQLRSNLLHVYRDVKEELIGYQLEWQEVDSVSPVLIENNGDELLTTKLNEINASTKRIMITLDLNNHQKTPAEMNKYFIDRVEDHKRYLSVREQELFRDVLLNNIGQRIRNKITKVSEWVEQINTLMRTHESGLRIHLRWKPKLELSEGGESSIMELLRRDPKTITDEAMERITKYFSEKIRQAKVMLQEERKEKALKTLHQIVKETLDYRKWFEFVLHAQRKGMDDLQELTQKRFNKYSGGEKAMAMYIPLFTATYSRYLDAKDDAPQIITMDEAFAGVDYDNIDKMFNLLENLGFDYVMNSQSLWADSPSVKSIAIYELIRPQGSNVVAVERYVWDGKSIRRPKEEDYLA